MDAFSYNDIFATKGIEYIFIIAFLILLIPFWNILNKESVITSKLKRAVGVLSANLLRLPMGLLFAKNHTWVFLEESGNAKLGLDDFLVQSLGHINVNILKSPGDKLEKGDLLAEINQNGKKLAVYSPISGEVVISNEAVPENHELLIQDPYKKGWLYSVRPSNWVNEIHSFYLADETKNWINTELERLKDFLSDSFAKHAGEPAYVAYQEGGELLQNILSHLDIGVWNDFQESFMNKKFLAS